MTEPSANSRLEAFCDAVFAIAMTLLVIDLRIPSTVHVQSTADLWRALRDLTPSVFAFLLSFGIILITWVNHHGTMKWVRRSSATFIYANGFLLLTVVFIPFPTRLLGEFLGTAYAAPAVVLYDAVMAVQAVAWALLCRSALKNNLVTDDRSAAEMRGTLRNAYLGLAVYVALAVMAVWLPLVTAAVTTGTMLLWFIFGLRLKHG